MRGKLLRRGGRTAAEAPAPAAAADAGHAGSPPAARAADAALVLPCALRVLGTTQERETGRPLGDLLRRIGYL